MTYKNVPRTIDKFTKYGILYYIALLGGGIFVKLSAAILCHELKKRYPLGCYNCTQTSLTLKRPLLWDSGRTAEHSRVYVLAPGSAPSLADLPADSLLVFCGGVPDVLPLCSYICFAGPQAVEQVLNDLQIIFDRYLEWDESLERLSSGSSIQDILDCSTPIFENMLVMTDISFRIVAFAAPRTSAGGDASLPPRTTAQRQARLRQFYADQRDEQPPFPVPREILGFEKLACNFFDSGVNIGSLTVHPCSQPLRLQDSALLAHVRMRVAGCWRRLAPLECPERHLGKLLRRLLEEGTVDRDHLLFALSYATCGGAPLFCCLAVPLPEKWEREHLLYLQRRLSQEPGALAFFDCGGKLHILQNLAGGAEEGTSAEGIAQILESVELQAGVSDPFSDITLFPYYCAEASFAAGRGPESGGRMLLFRDHVDQYVLENCCGALKREMLYPPGFQRLLDHDEGGKVSYADTLKAYLDANMNALQASARLYISRNTLLARLAHIRALLGMDLEDPDVRFILSVCIRLHSGQSG